jgi:photosystem II stability/assembly factor-like uncharacterized protein
VASDATGSHLVAAGEFGDIWTSTDSGTTWIDRTPSGSAHNLLWASVVSDGAGANLAAISGGGFYESAPGNPSLLWTSSDSGVTWTNRTPAGADQTSSWYALASDSTGAKLVAVGSGIWTSVNAGVTWTQQTTPGNANASWVSVASDAAGTHLVAATGGPGSTGDLWTSADSGATWVNETAGTSAASQAWTSVASDKAGAHLVAVAMGGDIWTN